MARPAVLARPIAEVSCSVASGACELVVRLDLAMDENKRDEEESGSGWWR